MQAARRYRRRSSGNTRLLVDMRTEDVEVGNVFSLKKENVEGKIKQKDVARWAKTLRAEISPEPGLMKKNNRTLEPSPP